MFKTATAFHINEDTRTLFQDAASWLHLDDPLPMDMAWSKMGIEPLSTGEAFIDVQGAVYFEVAKGKRVLPSSTIKREVATRLKEYTANGETVSRALKGEITSEYLGEALPNAPVTVTKIPCVMYGHMLYIGASSVKLVDDVMSYLRSLEPFVATRLNLRDKYQRFLNDVALQDVRSDLHVDGSSAKIQDASGKKISISNMGGDVGDLQTLLEQGYNVVSLNSYYKPCNDINAVPSSVFKLTDVGTVVGLKCMFVNENDDGDALDQAGLILIMANELRLIYGVICAQEDPIEKVSEL